MDQLVVQLSARTDTSKDSKIIEFSITAKEQLVSDWACAANSSNFGNYGTYTLALATLLEIPCFPRNEAIAVAKCVAKQELKVIYRALTLMRQAQTMPTLTLLKRFAVLIPNELHQEFDFTLRVIPQILSQQPYRAAFLDFFMELISRSSASIRRELLANRKVFSGWFGKLGQEDDENTVARTFDLLRERVLKDTIVFIKSTKMGLFNDWTLKNIQRILSAPQISEALAEKIGRFIVTLLCDITYGVRMPSENRLALSFLKIVKPWENKAQMDLTVRLLEEMPELVVPYFDALVVAYPLTPKASMWWFSFSVLHISTLKLNLSYCPPLDSSGLNEFAKWVLPATITRSALQQAVRFKESALVQFQASQITLFALRRLRSVLNVVRSSYALDENTLVDLVLSRLPESQLFSKPVERDLLSTTYLIILKEFCQLRPQSVSINNPLDSNEVNGLKLIQAEQILEVQTYTSDQTRWWNSNREVSSLFLQLVKFSTFNPVLADKSSKLLQHLVEPTQLFADLPTLAHPIDALIFTLGSYIQIYQEVNHLVWELLEQTVQRSVRTPYQYIDQFKSKKISPFLIGLVDQYVEHLSKRDSSANSLSSWIRNFARALLVLGEEPLIIDSLMKRLDSVNPRNLPKKSEEYFDFVLDETDRGILDRQDLLLKINSRLDLAATLYRASSTESPVLRNHLLAHIPADLLDIMAMSPPAFAPFLRGSSSLTTAYISILEGRKNKALSTALELSANWASALEWVSTEFLLSKLSVLPNRDTDESVVNELTRRKHILSDKLLEIKLKTPGIAENINLRAPLSLDANLGLALMKKAEDAALKSSLIRVSGVYDNTQTLPPDSQILVAVAKFARSYINEDEAFATALELLYSEGSELSGVCIVAQFVESLRHGHEAAKLEIWDACSKYIESARHGLHRSILSADFLTLVRLKPPFLARFLKVAVHQITLRCAERKYGEDTGRFIAEFIADDYHMELLWTHVNPNAINALIEAAMREQRYPETYEMVTKIALKEREILKRSKGASSKLTGLAHLLTVFERTRPNECSLEIALMIYSIFASDPPANSSLEVEQGILARYDGSSSPKDRILLQTLKTVEAQRQRSWVDHVESWEIRPAFSSSAHIIDDYGLDSLIVVRCDASIFVTLDEQRIYNTINAWEVEPSWELEPNTCSYYTLISSINSYSSRLSDTSTHRYDPSFMLNCLTSCEQLTRNLDSILNSGLLSFLICCLANREHRDDATSLLTLIFKRLAEIESKYQVGMRLLLGKLLMFCLNLNCRNLDMPSHIPSMIGQMALVISRPNHFMAEKIHRWLLSGPKIQEFEVPMFKTILESQAEFKAKELLWLLNLISAGAVDRTAVQYFVKAGVIEWVLSQVSLSNSRSQILKDAALRLINRIEEVRGGAHVLISTSGALAMPEIQERVFQAANIAATKSWVQSKVLT